MDQFGIGLLEILDLLKLFGILLGEVLVLGLDDVGGFAVLLELGFLLPLGFQWLPPPPP